MRQSVGPALPVANHCRSRSRCLKKSSVPVAANELLNSLAAIRIILQSKDDFYLVGLRV